MKWKRNMKQTWLFRVFGLIAITLMAGLTLAAQTGDPTDLLLQRLNKQFVPTVFNQDETDIVTPGTVVAVMKDGDISEYIQDPNKPRWGVVVYRLPLKYCPISTYKKGALSLGFGDLSDVASGDNINFKEFLSYPLKYLKKGDKVWISGFGFGKNTILAKIVTDPYDDGRYCGMLKFPYEKGHLPTPDDAVRMISEVLAVQPAQEQTQPPRTEPAAPPPPISPPAPAQHQYEDVAPPPPPPAPAATISIGQTKTQVTAAFGEPQRKATAGPKEIFFYTDLKMKVTFTNGKVSSID
jgi:hypothetical protein